MVPNEELGLKGDGVERKAIKALDEAMGELISQRTKRMNAGKKEKEQSAIVVGLFKQHRLKSYNYDDRTYDLKSLEKVVVHKEEAEDED